jgi:hypothetical protein
MPEGLRAEALQFRVLYRRFSLRVIDLDAVSAKGDSSELLGKFAAILIMLSMIWGVPPLLFGLEGRTAPQRFDAGLGWENRLISATMLVAGLFTVLAWDSTFPDRRDAMVILPLPVRTRTLFSAKIAASCTVIVISVLLLNSVTGLTWPLILSGHGLLSVIRAFVAYGVTVVASGAFLFCSVLAVQGITAQIMPRRYFVRLAAILQIVAFCLFLAVYFLQPQIATLHSLGAPENQRSLSWLPSYWFVGLFNWLNGTMRPQLVPLAIRAVVGLVVSVSGALAGLLLCCLRTLRRTIEEPDIVSRGTGFHWCPGLHTNLSTAMLQFSLRSFARSRQHRIILAFYLGVGFALALTCLRIPAAHTVLAKAPLPLMSQRYLTPTFLILAFVLVGARVAFAIPVALPANWVFRITELRPPQEYCRTNRSVLFFLTVAPACAVTALVSLPMYSWGQVFAHCAALALVGVVLVDLSLLRFHKIPFTCSWLPGRANVQFAFWAYFLLLVPVTVHVAQWEQYALEVPARRAIMLALLTALAICTCLISRFSDQSAVIRFEEAPEPVILGLDLQKD